MPLIFRFRASRSVAANVLLLTLLSTAACGGSTKNSFDLQGALIPLEAVSSGGPAKDGIPAIDAPHFVAADKADFVNDRDFVLGLARQKTAKAYPIAILNWHEIVNDTIAGEAVVVTFCPLCGTGMAYEATIAGKKTDFGVSGLLYNSDVLLYDRPTQSLWSQLLAKAVTGPLKGTRLKLIPLAHTTWQDWKSRHPNTLVLSTETGAARDYTDTPYKGYEQSEQVWFPVTDWSKRYHPKARVIGIEIDGKFKAYPFVELSKTGKKQVNDRFAGRELVVRFSKKHRSAAVYTQAGEELPGIIAFWFAWYTFHPETAVFEAKTVSP
ncbi:MAG: DUF3179 domain-containing protein [Gammaproteobacteria bacterium]|nr:DUF3179 domain-containing protein [Gammaproteobacteria bacterium]